MEKSTIWGDEIPIGKFFERTDLPSLDQAEPVLKDGPMVGRPEHIDPAAAQAFIEELM
jgi:2-oxoglutarate ferredoxin oxidoreductase subunit beta